MVAAGPLRAPLAGVTRGRPSEEGGPLRPLPLPCLLCTRRAMPGGRAWWIERSIAGRGWRRAMRMSAASTMIMTTTAWLRKGRGLRGEAKRAPTSHATAFTAGREIRNHAETCICILTGSIKVMNRRL